MLEQGSGHIVNVSSVAGHISPPYMGMYAATKHALAAVSDALRIELGGTGVGVSTIFPGLTDTSFTENMLQEVEAPQIPPIARFVGADVVARRIFQAVRWGLRDVYVSPEDVAGVVMDATMPLVMDWGMRLFMRPGPRHDVSFQGVPASKRPAKPLSSYRSVRAPVVTAASRSQTPHPALTRLPAAPPPPATSGRRTPPRRLRGGSVQVTVGDEDSEGDEAGPPGPTMTLPFSIVTLSETLLS